MESYLKKDLDVVEQNHPSPETLGKWRKAVRLVKNPARRWRHVADLAARAEDEQKKKQIQEKIEVALYVQKAALQFIEACGKQEIVYRRGPGCKPKSP